jgi:hypothetical protein
MIPKEASTPTGFFPSGGVLAFALGQAGRNAFGEPIRPGIATVIIKRGVAITHLRLFVDQVPAAKTAGRQFISTREGDTVTPGPKFLQVDHTPSFLTVFLFSVFGMN